MRKYFYSLILILGISFAVSSSPSLFAQTKVDDLKQKIDGTSSTIKQLEEEIKQYTTELNKTSAEAKTLQSTIKNLDLTDKKLTTDIKVTENKIDYTNLTIEQLRNEIGDKEAKIEINRRALTEAIRQMNATDSTSLMEAMFIYPNISSFMNEIQTLQQFQEKVRNNVDELRGLRESLVKNKSQTEIKKTELVGLKSQLNDQKQVVVINKTEKNKVLAVTQSKEVQYKQIIADKVAKKAAFEQELRKYESELKIAIDPSSIPNSRSGLFIWPTEFKLITQNFGYTDFAQSGAYNGNGHNGIDIKAPTGSKIFAAMEGVVKGIGDTDNVCAGASYGKWVLVEHPNGLSTLYAHLSLVKVGSGQQVATGDILGYSGATGYATGPHLHFTVYATQGVKIMQRQSAVCGGAYTMPIADVKAYLNPMNYL